jgi:hypothetical protein
MKKASRNMRVRYRHPRIRFVLPKIEEGKVPEIDKILNEIRKAGVTVECGIRGNEAHADDGPDTADSEEELKQVYERLLPSSFTHFTDTLNVDCTLLLALVSDLSHLKGIKASPNYHRAILRQIEMETKEPLVPSELWPAMTGRTLLCTKEAAKRMGEIVDTIGTDSEKARTELLFGDGDCKGLEREVLIERFQKMSDHDVPKDWMIPIEVVDSESDINEAWKDGRLPDISHKVAEAISPINQSVFLYGWAKGMMTVSSNRTVAKQIEAVVEENRNGDDEVVGPDVWLCDTARSLVGKEKNRKA